MSGAIIADLALVSPGGLKNYRDGVFLDFIYIIGISLSISANFFTSIYIIVKLWYAGNRCKELWHSLTLCSFGCQPVQILFGPKLPFDELYKCSLAESRHFGRNGDTSSCPSGYPHFFFLRFGSCRSLDTGLCFQVGYISAHTFQYPWEHNFVPLYIWKDLNLSISVSR